MRELNVKTQMRKGVLEYSILLILSRGAAYSSHIISQLKSAEMIVVEGTLYPLLSRLKSSGLLSYHWEESPQGPPRKVYALTSQGHEMLSLLDESWLELVEQIKTIKYNNYD